MLSGIFDTTTAEANPPLQAYFGSDASRFAERSALPGLCESKLPMLFAYAELDSPDFHRQAEQLRAALRQAGLSWPVRKLLGHSHMSEIYSINKVDHALTDALSAFVAGAR